MDTDYFVIVPVNGHYEVYLNGEFYCSADTHTEAMRAAGYIPEID